MDTAPLTLYIGNRNYSSWSLRAWLLMRQLDLPFDEKPLRLFTAEFRDTLSKLSPVARVPLLLDGDFAIWESLAIVEYLAERFPEAGVWPADPRERARARSICAEMHAGFGQLRSRMPMNIEAHLPGMGWDLAVQADIDRIVAIWTELRLTHADRGAFLFGRFSAADAFFAPVCSRFTTHAVALPEICDAYRQAVLVLPAMRAWTEAALAEQCFVPEDEPYRRAR